MSEVFSLGSVLYLHLFRLIMHLKSSIGNLSIGNHAPINRLFLVSIWHDLLAFAIGTRSRSGEARFPSRYRPAALTDGRAASAPRSPPLLRKRSAGTMAAMPCAAPATACVARARALARRSGTSTASRPVARREPAAPRAVADVSADAQALEVNLADSLRPSSADCAKTLVAIADTGTLATTGEDGVALGAFASYVVAKSGDVVLRMRADAVHTSNIAREPRCSLYVQPTSQPPGVISRATLIGALEKLDGDDVDAQKAASLYDETHGAGVGVDARDGVGDEYYVFKVDRVFYVGGLGSDKRAEVVTAEAYANAAADPLCKHAGAIVDATNGERYEDVMNFARASLPADVEPAEARMLWMDKLGFDVRVVTGGNGKQKVLDVRLPFPAAAETQQQALSALTMLAQTMWEEEKQYQPVPVPREPKEEKEE